jgi:hypothetical protein
MLTVSNVSTRLALPVTGIHQFKSYKNDEFVLSSFAISKVFHPNCGNFLILIVKATYQVHYRKQLST